MVRMFRYVAGGEVQPGDQVRYHGQPGKVEFVASERIGDPATDWYIDEYAGGVMISAEQFGAVFLALNDIDEHLEFVARTLESTGAAE